MRYISTAAVICTLVLAAALPATAAYTSAGDRLFAVDLETGMTTEVGPYGLAGARVWSLARSSDGVLYGVDDLGNRLVTIDPATGLATSVGPLGLDVVGGDLAFDACGELWFLGRDGAETALLHLDPDSGAATVIRSGYDSLHGIAALGDRLITADSASAGPVRAYEIDRQSGDLTPLVTLDGFPPTFAADLDFDAGGVLWGHTEFPTVPPPPPSGLVTIDLVSGEVTAGPILSGSPFIGLAVAAPTGTCRSTPVTDVPTLTRPGLLALVMLVATAGLLFLVRRRRGAEFGH